MSNAVPISPVKEIVAELAAGRMVVLVDEEDRENEGDLVMAADHVTPAAINFMAKHGRGLICLTLTRERCEFLKLPPMASSNGTQYATAFTVSIEAATGVTTGISAADRAKTVQVAVAPDTQPADLVQPGHVFPLQAVDGGVLMRAGHTEAGCDLSAMAGCSPAAVICEIMNDDGSMARLPDLQIFAATHGLKIGTIADLIEYRSANESLVKRVGSRTIQTPQGAFVAHAFQDSTGGNVHLALVNGEGARAALGARRARSKQLHPLLVAASKPWLSAKSRERRRRLFERGRVQRTAPSPVSRHRKTQSRARHRSHGPANLRYWRTNFA